MENKRYYDVKDVMSILNIKQAKAYAIIKELNDELKTKGYLTLSGKIPSKFFNEKLYC